MLEPYSKTQITKDTVYFAEEINRNHWYEILDREHRYVSKLKIVKSIDNILLSSSIILLSALAITYLRETRSLEPSFQEIGINCVRQLEIKYYRP